MTGGERLLRCGLSPVILITFESLRLENYL